MFTNTTYVYSSDWADTLLKTFEKNNFAGSVATVTYDEKTNTHIVAMDAPGYAKSDIDITIENDAITISAKNEKRGTKRCAYYLDDIDRDKIEAKLEDGVLTVKLPRLQSSLPKKVTVQ